MDPILASLTEESLELFSASLRYLVTPNPFRPLDGPAPWWQSYEPQDFYAIPASPPRLSFYRVRSGSERIRARFTFASYDRTPYRRNNTVHGLATLSPHPRAAMIFVHGHAMRSFTLLEFFSITAARLGLDIYFIALPYHMQRAPLGTWSGQYHLNSDVEGTALAFRQGVRDVRALLSWIEQEKGLPVVLAGVSLGAFTCCMTGVVDPRPKALISILGGASLAQIHWDGYQMGLPRRQLRAGGVSRARHERYWAMLGPGNWKPAIARERILMVAGAYDPIVTPENTERLWQAWDRPPIRWYPCGHGTIVAYYREVVRAARDLLKTCVMPV